MGTFSQYLGINRILSLMFSVLWVLSTSEGETISKVVGSKVTLHCNNSNGTFNQLMWKVNGVLLVSFKPPTALYTSKEAKSMKISSENQQCSLVIESFQESHTGNYTCEIVSSQGVQQQKWELMITGHEVPEPNKLVTVVAAVLPCVCCLILIIAWIILQRCHRHAANSNPYPTAEMQDIYENCLEINVRQQ